MRKIIFIAIALLASFVFAKSFGTFGTYSEGTRSGNLTKLSKKGIFFKTWEGELILGGLKTNSSGDIDANIFEFSVNDEEVAKKLESLVGTQVTLEYIEPLIVGWSDGKTGYLIKSIKN